MPKRTCSKGHIYDSAIYGDNCPFCPSAGTGTIMNNFGGDTVGTLRSTEVNQESSGRTQVTGAMTGGPTIPWGGDNQAEVNGGTIIRPVGEGMGTPSGKRIVGLFVTYDTVATGQVFNIYEGRNYVGRDAASDICIQGDSQISGRHFSVLFRVADGKFKFRDEQSSNGTFVGDVLTDEGELNSFDIIRIGSTRLLFIAIPQIK